MVEERATAPPGLDRSVTDGAPRVLDRPALEDELTVVIVAWGEYAGSMLNTAIASLRAQDLVPRLLVVDNASAERIAPSNADVVRSAVRLSVGAARNLGLAAVETPLVMFWDADDVMPPGTLAMLRAQMDDPEVVLAASLIAEFDGRPHHWPRRLTIPLARLPRVYALMNVVSSLFPTTGGVMIRTAVARDAGGFPDYDASEDRALGVSLAFRGKVVVCRQPGRRYRRHASSVSANWRAYPNLTTSARRIRRRLREDPAVPRPVRTAAPLFAIPQWFVIFVLRTARLLVARARGTSYR